VIPTDDSGARERLAHIARMIEHYRQVKKHRLQRQAAALWRQVEAQQALVQFEKPPDRVH
jgi:hypothetical protein